MQIMVLHRSYIGLALRIDARYRRSKEVSLSSVSLRLGVGGLSEAVAAKR